MKKITILMLHLQHGGIEKQTISLANHLAERYEVEFISTYNMLNTPAYEVSDKVKIKYLINGRPNKQEIKDAIKSKNLFRIFKEAFTACKIIIMKSSRMKREIKNLKCDYVLSTRIEFAEMLSSFAPKGTVTLTQEHLHNDSTKYVNRARKAFRNLDYLLVLCDGSRENFSKWLKDNKKIKIVQIPNILDSIPKDSANLKGNTIVSAGRLHPVKNFEALIDAFAIVKRDIPDSSLVIIGGGDEFNKLNARIKSLSLEDSAKITGMVSADEVRSFMLISDIYAMTSHTECFPMVLLEASSVGLPLVAFDVPVGPKSIIEDSKNGYLIEYENIAEMAERIIFLLKNREVLINFGKDAKEKSNQYLAENIMQHWYDLFV